jgi:hypothetical protein
MANVSASWRPFVACLLVAACGASDRAAMPRSRVPGASRGAPASSASSLLASSPLPPVGGAAAASAAPPVEAAPGSPNRPRCGEAPPASFALALAAPKPISAPRHDVEAWRKQVVAMMLSLDLKTTGLPAVSRDGRAVVYLDRGGFTSGRPPFDWALVVRELQGRAPERSFRLLSDREIEAALPANVEGAASESALTGAYEVALARHELLREQVAARVGRAKAAIAKRVWLPMASCDEAPAGPPGAPLQVAGLSVSLRARAPLPPLLRVEDAQGRVRLERSDASLLVPERASGWGACGFAPALHTAAVDPARRVLFVQVTQTVDNDLCAGPFTYGAYRLAP